MERKKIRVLCLTVITLIISLGMTGYGEETDSTFEGFVRTLSEVLEERNNIVQDKLSKLEENAQPAEIMQICQDAAKAEWKKIQQYENSSFGEDMPDEEAIRKEYVEGLKIQMGCDQEAGEDKFWEEWQNGFKQRACAIVELVDILPDVDVSGIPQKTVDEMRTYTGKPCDNGSDEAYFIQALLAKNECITSTGIDGKLGDGTRKELRSFLESQKIAPVSCVINRKLIVRLIEEDIVNEEVFSDVCQILSNAGITVDDTFTYEALKNSLKDSESEQEDKAEPWSEVQSETETTKETDAA